MNRLPVRGTSLSLDVRLRAVIREGTAPEGRDTYKPGEPPCPKNRKCV